MPADGTHPAIALGKVGENLDPASPDRLWHALWWAHLPGERCVNLTLLKTGLIAALSLAAASAQASLTYTFTTAGGGTILGQIDGLLDIAGTQASTGVWVNNFSGAGFPGSFTVPYNFGSGGSFTVVGGALVTASFSGFRAGNPATQFTFNLATPSFSMHSFNNGADLSGSNLAFSSFPVSVPEPGSALLVLTALAGLAGLRRMKRQPLRPRGSLGA